MSSLPPLELDVRPLFAAGRPPLPAILNAISRLEPGQSFRLIAPLKPAPLFDLLAARGYTAEPKELANGVWEILFTPTGAA